MKHWHVAVLLLAALATAAPGGADARSHKKKGFGSPMMKDGGKKGDAGSDGADVSPMHPSASRDLQEKTGLVSTGLRPVYPKDATCLEVKSFFADQTRFDGSSRASWANHGYHGGFDISARIGTPLVAIAAGEVVHKYEGGMLVGKQIFLRHTPDDTGLSIWIYSKYKHFDKMPDFELGDRVKMGQFLGPSGDSGTAGKHFPSGYPHLHMSIYTSRSPDYKTKKRTVVPKDVRQLDPVAIYITRTPPILDSHAARDLADSEKDVPIPYKTTGGRVVPAGTRLVWPLPCGGK